MKVLDPFEVAEQINVPVPSWPGRCYEVAGLLISNGVLEGTLRYGHWLGPISKYCLVEVWRDNPPFVQHGWIELDGETVVDPTRWVFENKDPYIYWGSNEHYDVGGNQWRKAMRNPCPSYSPSAPRASLDIWKLDRDAHKFTMNTIFGGAPGITVDMVFWLANLAPDELGIYAQPIFQAIVDAGYAAAIPIDNRELVLGE